MAEGRSRDHRRDREITGRKNIIGQPILGVEVAIYKAVVEVRPDGEEPFRTELGVPKPVEHFRFPRTGQVGVLFDRKSRKVNWDPSDPRVFADDGHEKREEAFDATLRAPAGSPPTKAS